MNSRHSLLVTLAVGELVARRGRRGGAAARCRTRSLAPSRRSRRCPRGRACQLSGSIAKQAGGRQLAISRFERILGEGREDVGQEQLLVLLLVVDAELDQRQRFGRQRRQRALERLVDMSAIGADLVERRAAEHAAPGPRVTRAFAFVIAVEQEGVALVERAVAGDVIAQHEGLEEPGGVGEMPFGRRGVGERLDGGVGVRQRRGEVERQLARREQSLGERAAGSGTNRGRARLSLSAAALRDRRTACSRFAR